ncbi:hypothetical protein HPB50_006080 [Hyalomma asiaticum]|uniref:Uncharacterized protein n=1 Tax=Hyalomma asiaticum TaxID=266040 RepID=A0ACB7STE7_HYAAI|nr:hypothetical protein HPB50_006080 [Hyalomma asiaticum]
MQELFNPTHGEPMEADNGDPDKTDPVERTFGRLHRGPLLSVHSSVSVQERLPEWTAYRRAL